MTFAIFGQYEYRRVYYYYAIVRLVYCPRVANKENIINVEKSYLNLILILFLLEVV